MKVEVEIQHPDESGLPGRARELLGEKIGRDRVRELFPRTPARRAELSSPRRPSGSASGV